MGVQASEEFPVSPQLKSSLDLLAAPPLPPGARERLMARVREVTAQQLGGVQAFQAPAGSFREAMEAAREGSPYQLGGILWLVRPQVRLLGPLFWLISIAVMAAGVLLTPLTLNAGVWPVSLGAVLATVIGLAYSLRATYYNTVEIEHSCPIEPAQLVAARVSIVLFWNIILASAATILTMRLLPSVLLSQLVLSWLAPLLFLTGVVLWVSLRFGSVAGSALGLGLWAVQLVGNVHLGVLNLFSPAIISSEGLTVRIAAMGLGIALSLAAWRRSSRWLEQGPGI